MKLQADHQWHRESSAPALAQMVPHQRLCPIHATLPVLCVISAEITLLAAAVLCRIPPSWPDTSSNCLAQNCTIYWKKKSVFFAFCFSNMPSLFLSPLLFMTPLCCLCHWGIHPRVPIISDSLPGPANPSAVTAPHNSHFVNNHNPHSDSISAHSTHKWKNSFLRRN